MSRSEGGMIKLENGICGTKSSMAEERCEMIHRYFVELGVGVGCSEVMEVALASSEVTGSIMLNLNGIVDFLKEMPYRMNSNH